VTLAARAKADAIVAVTHEGRTARVLSARRPAAPVYAATNDIDVARRVSSFWGIAPIPDSLEGDADAVALRVAGLLRERSVLPAPATIVIVNANPALERPGVNFVAVRRIP
jgi:pyruvate kinase